LSTLLVVSFIGACFYAVKTGGKVTLWPPSVKGSDRIVGVSATLKVEAGVVKMPSEREAFYNTGHEVFLKSVQQKIRRTCSVPIEYKKPFREKPKIFLALSKIDVGGSVGQHIDRLGLRNENEHTDGFHLIFETWEDSIVFNAEASWIAIGEWP